MTDASLTGFALILAFGTDKARYNVYLSNFLIITHIKDVKICTRGHWPGNPVPVPG